MKCESIQQFAIVNEDSASAFEEVLNAKMKELSRNHPVIAFNENYPFYARISYTQTVEIPENVADQFELEGACFHCGDCPMFQPILKADGTVDGRVRYGNCEMSEFGRTYKDSKACDQLYKMLKSGRIGLCLKE